MLRDVVFDFDVSLENEEMSPKWFGTEWGRARTRRHSQWGRRLVYLKRGLGGLVDKKEISFVSKKTIVLLI